ncbi:hypothetical protein AJ80_00341 [Polytolypa hystricis UAMH7299]|uniref:F-box domain-containing protein n=1 Tax=Polytolypa hystricis (strain UAMH7299) TaxID=1447883 RepID=A0A2B7YVH1_POLH7|nr:hypothetical protein AJ80_00341 [Polytolypa hystricis UAMH7299]
MSDSPYCVLCGGFIFYRSPRSSWETEFRAVRVSDDEHKTRFLTGVGGFIHRDLGFSAPSDIDGRYDKISYRVMPADEFPPLVGTRHRPDPGYVFHDQCWQVLTMQLYPHPMPIERFYDICRAFPVRQLQLDWGHAYGGLLKTTPLDFRHPWEQPRIVSYVAPVLVHGVKKASPLDYYKKDPLDIPELQQTLGETYHCQKNTATEESSCVSPQIREYTDCFSSLPVELLEQIQRQLRIQDVTSLRFASRSFASLPLSQSFWSSRFESGLDRDYVFETQVSTPHRHRDWRTLYDKTRAISGGLANRRRIWDSNRSFANLLLTKPRKALGPEQQQEYHHIPWRSIGGAIGPIGLPLQSTASPCKQLYQQSVRLPQAISQIAVSLISFNERKYVTGLRFLSTVGQDAEIGYILPGKEVMLKMSDANDKPGTFAGFVVAVGPTGIHALRATMLEGHLSQWAGCPDEIPQSLRLCMTERITHLKGGFDSFKMVTLAVPSTATDPEASPHLPLRATAIWYPTIPSPNLYLHETTFVGQDVPLSEFRPLIPVMFGGPRGAYLEYLTRIVVTVANSVIVGIDFEYDNEAGGAPIERMRACKSTVSADESVKMTFSIDGPGGEVLTNMQVKGDYWMNTAQPDARRHGAITSLEVATNKKRSFTFQPSLIPQLKIPPGPQIRKRTPKIVITPGTTITGIYVMHDSYLGMISLGPISEVLGNEWTADVRSALPS